MTVFSGPDSVTIIRIVFSVIIWLSLMFEVGSCEVAAVKSHYITE